MRLRTAHGGAVLHPPQYQRLVFELGRLLREQQPDVVHVATPPQSHLEVALQAIEAGCHVLVEKPLAENARQASRLVGTARTNGCKLAIGWTHYFDPAIRAARNRIAQGLIGSVIHLEACTAYDLGSDFGAAVLQDRTHWVHRLPGKLLQNNLDHTLAVLAEYMEPADGVFEVRAWRATDSPYPDLFDELRVAITCANISAYILFSCRAKPVGLSFRIIGSKSTLSIDLVNQIITQASVSDLRGPLGKLMCAVDQTHQLARQTLCNLIRFARSEFQPLPGLGSLISDFYKCIVSGGNAPISDAHMLRVCAMMDQVVQQLQEATITTL